MNVNKIIYYLVSLMLSVIILMVSGEQLCKCNCESVNKYALKSYMFGDEFLAKKDINDIMPTSSYSHQVCKSERIYRFPIEIIAALLFFILMTGFIIF